MATLPSNPRGLAVALLRCIGISLALTFASLAQADPPMRVARLGYLGGAVSFSPAGETTWVAGTLNRPVVTGDRLWADDRGRVELQIGSAMVRLGARTLFTLTNLDDRIAQMNLQDGTINLRVRRLERNQVVEVDTPNLAFVIRQEGEYRITVDAARDSTEVRTRSGRAEVFGKDARYTIGLGRAYAFYGAGLTDYDVLTMPRVDEFDRWCQLRDRRYETSTSARYVSRDVIGYQDLDQYGSWRSVPQYGNVWTPTRVAANWAPYRDGHWSWVEPWGWTWVDEQPWGFAVSHYGRWVNDSGRWGWIPGPVAARAVYAPALVAFIGGSNFQVAGTSGNVGAVGWFPLGPREVYRPAYAVSREYFTNVNITNTVINNTTIINNYDNGNANTVAANAVYVNKSVPGAVVAVPATAFVQSQPVGRAVMRVSEAALMAAPVIALAAVAPMQSSVLGGAALTRALPPQISEQRFVAQSPPPVAPVPFAVKERALAANPGKPVEAAVLATLKPQALPPARGASGSSPSPAPVMVAPRVDVVPEARTLGAAVVAPPPRAPSDRGAVSEQRAPQSMPPSGQPLTAPPPAPAIAPPGTRPPTSVAPDAPRPGNRPAEAPGRAVVAPPVQPAPAAAPQAPVRPLPPAQPQAAPPSLPAAPAARTPAPPIQEVPRPGNRASEAPGRINAPPPIVPGAEVAPRPQRPGNAGRDQRDTPPASVAPSAPVRAVPPPQAPPPAPAAAVVAPPQPAGRVASPPAVEAPRPGNRSAEAPGRVMAVPPTPAVPPAVATPPAPPVAPALTPRPGNSAREQRDAAPVAPAAPPAQLAPPPPTRVSPGTRQPQPPAPPAEPGARAPVEPRQVPPERAAGRPQSAPTAPAAAPPAVPGRPGEPPAAAVPPKPAPGDRRPQAVEEKKGEKLDENGNPIPDDKERKRR